MITLYFNGDDVFAIVPADIGKKLFTYNYRLTKGVLTITEI